jgi:hypothetical protein
VRETGERRLPDAVGGGYCLASTDPIAPASQKLGHRGDRKLDLKFLDAAHIRDILALLRFVENPRDGIAGNSA